ncbi:MAG: alkaline phosphatase D family protein [Actinomycetota bacterium]
MHRRRFLAGLSGLALAACSGSGQAEAPPTTAGATSTSGPDPQPDASTAPAPPTTTEPGTDWRPAVPAVAPFALGVASGDPTADAVAIWTRLIDDPLTGAGPDGPVEVRWEVASDPDLDDVVAGGVTTADAASAHAVQVVVEGLDAGSVWFYRFSVGDERSMVGRTRTAPSGGADRLRLAVASCQRYQDGTYVAHRHLAEADVDVVLFLGDVIYADGGGGADDVRPYDSSPPRDLDAFRRRHARYRSDPDLQACLAAHPWVVTRDDNDVTNGWGPDSDLRVPAEQALVEHHPMRRSGDDLRRAIGWGDLADLLLVDVRPHRSPRAGREASLGAVAADASLRADDRTMLGPEQETWLGERLGASNARWQLVASQVMVGDLSVELGGDTLLNNDQWDGYPAARRRLVDQLRAAPAPIVLAGDLHSGVIDVLRDGDGEVVATELVTPSISSAVDDRIATAVSAAPLFRSDLLEVRGGVNGWVELTVGPERTRAEIVVIDAIDPAAEPTVAVSALIDRTGGPPTVTG